MLYYIAQIFWLFFPAGLANMAPVLFKWIPFDTPIDFDKTWRGKVIFGPHKTYRGFIVGILSAIAFLYLQKVLALSMPNFVMIDYNTVNLWLLGFLMGFGALFGDLLSSFFKRQVGIAPGKAWVPVDQIDWSITAIALTALYISISWKDAITAFVLSFIFHPICNYLAYVLRIKKNKF